MSYLGREQATGTIRDKLEFDKIKEPKDTADYLNSYYEELAKKVSGLESR